MAEKREDWLQILLKFSGKRPTVKVELFESMQWADPAAAPGVHRVRKGGIHGGKWLPENESRLVFYHIDDVLQLLRAEILGGRSPHEAQPVPPHTALRDRARVRWKRPDPDNLPNGVQTWAKGDPIRAYDGRWMIYLAGEVGWVPCSEVTPLDHCGRPIPNPEAQS